MPITAPRRGAPRRASRSRSSSVNQTYRVGRGNRSSKTGSQKAGSSWAVAWRTVGTRAEVTGSPAQVGV